MFVNVFWNLTKKKKQKAIQQVSITTNCGCKWREKEHAMRTAASSNKPIEGRKVLMKWSLANFYKSQTDKIHTNATQGKCVFLVSWNPFAKGNINLVSYYFLQIKLRVYRNAK